MNILAPLLSYFPQYHDGELFKLRILGSIHTSACWSFSFHRRKNLCTVLKSIPIVSSESFIAVDVGPLLVSEFFFVTVVSDGLLYYFVAVL